MNASARRVVVVGVSHNETPVELRERVHLDHAAAADVARELAAGDAEAVFLSTCQRTEIYIAHADATTAATRAELVLRRLAGSAASELAAHVFVFADEEAVLHLMRVAAGLESAVLGEQEILAQVRKAHAAGATGGTLDRLFAHALRAGKRVRTQTGIASRPASVSAAAAQLAVEHSGGLAGKRVLVVGAGRTAQLAAVNLKSRGCDEIVIVNRTPGRAGALARRVAGRTADPADIGEEMRAADVVVSCTGAPGFVILHSAAASALAARAGRPILFLDLAMPRDVDPAIRRLPGCRVDDLDDLGETVAATGASRRGAAESAQAVILEEAKRFRSWQETLAVVPAITSLRRRAEEIRAAAVAEHHAELDPHTRGLVESVTARVVARLLHAPTVELRHAAARSDAAHYVAALERLFRLPKTGDDAGANAEAPSYVGRMTSGLDAAGGAR